MNRFLKDFSKLVGMAPFWGLTKIRPAFFWYLSTGLERRKAYLRVMAFLATLVGLHGAFAHMGIRGLGFDAPIGVKAIFGLYAAVNIVVSLAQVCLMIRATVFFCRDTYLSRKPPEYSVSDEMTMILYTLPVQILVMELILRYMPAGH